MERSDHDVIRRELAGWARRVDLGILLLLWAFGVAVGSTIGWCMADYHFYNTSVPVWVGIPAWAGWVSSWVLLVASTRLVTSPRPYGRSVLTEWFDAFVRVLAILIGVLALYMVIATPNEDLYAAAPMIALGMMATITIHISRKVLGVVRYLQPLMVWPVRDELLAPDPKRLRYVGEMLAGSVPAAIAVWAAWDMPTTKAFAMVAGAALLIFCLFAPAVAVGSAATRRGDLGRCIRELERGGRAAARQ